MLTFFFFVNGFLFIEHFYSRDKPPYYIQFGLYTQTKDNFCIKIEFNSQWTGLVHQYGHCFFVLETNLTAVTSRENALLITCLMKCVIMRYKNRMQVISLTRQITIYW